MIRTVFEQRTAQALEELFHPLLPGVTTWLAETGSDEWRSFVQSRRRIADKEFFSRFVPNAPPCVSRVSLELVGPSKNKEGNPMTTCTAQIDLTHAANTSVPISGTVTCKDGAGAHSKRVNQPYQGRPTAITLTGVTSVQMTASSPGFNNQTLTVTCGRYTQFELTQSPATPTIKITTARVFPKLLKRDAGVNLSWESSIPVSQLLISTHTSAGRFHGINESDPISPLTASGSLFVYLENPGAPYHITMQGLTGQSSTNVAEIDITAANNVRSLSDFLAASGVSGSTGIKRLVPAAASVSLKLLMGV
jgi:hypothetical protein